MRIWGRTYNEDGTWNWIEVTTAPNGDNSLVYLVNLIQVLKFSRNESPFFANYGIPAQLSVIQQIFPDIYVSATQRQFAPYFSSLIVARLSDPTPHYRINCTTNQGAVISTTVDIPT